MFPRSNESYTVGWICALPLEMAAARAMLDEDHGQPHEQDQNDRNNYHLGCIGKHNVVIACLPNGVYGTSSAAVVVTQMLSSFRSIKIGLMVGVGGGVPSDENDIRLGDVVVSKPGRTFEGVVQYDFGKAVGEGRFVRTGSLNKPPQVLLTAISSLEAEHMLGIKNLTRHLSDMVTKHPDMKAEFSHQGVEHDQLYEADYAHTSDKSSCELCDAQRVKNRPARSSTAPIIHYGLIASGNQVMRDSITRDRLRDQLNALCFEMEAAGIMDHFPCLVIRGICDYSDSHKNRRWQKYAAATAAAYAKELLYIVASNSVSEAVSFKAVDTCNSSLRSTTSGYNSVRTSRDSPARSKSQDTTSRSSTFVFTKTPFAKEDIALASLIPDKRYPHQDAISVIQIQEGQDYSMRIDTSFNQRVMLESKSSFKTIITKLFTTSLDTEMSDTFEIQSSEGRIYELRQPKALFQQLCNHDEVKKWLEDNYISGEKVYFIVGYRTLIDGTVVHEGQRVANLSTQDQIGSTTSRIGFPCEVTASHGQTSGNQSNFSTLGERIYAICYRRVGFKFLRGIDNAFLKAGNRWKPFFNVRGSDLATDEILEADIKDEDESGKGTYERFENDQGEEIFIHLDDDEDDDDDDDDEDDM